METLQSERCRGFVEHWKSLRPAGSLSVPYAAFLDNPHPVYAPYVYINEFVDGDILIVLMGTGIVEHWGRDRTGETFAKDQPAAVRNALYDNSIKASAATCGIHGILSFASSGGVPFIVETITLPVDTGPGMPLRRVSYSDYVKTLGEDDVAERYVGVPEVSWIDLGAGVPDSPPQGG